MIRYDADSATFRGDVGAIAGLRDRLSSGAGATDLPSLVADAGIEGLGGGSDPLVEAMATALSPALFTASVTVSGPGGHHEHVFDIGLNAVAVRHSPVTSDVAELNGFPMTMLPGAVSRVVRFRPGTPPAEDAHPLRLSARTVADLGDPDADIRRRAWAEVEPVLETAGYRDPEDPSWQLVQSRAAWTATGGERAEELSVHVRSADHYFVAVQNDEDIDLVPVPSITAWETMIQVLPGADEVQRPS